MTGSFWDLLIGIVGALLIGWLMLVGVLMAVRPRGGLVREALRLLPDVLRLVRRLAADESLPRGVRVRLGLLLVYLACPIDLIPDFIPVLGYADDAIIVTAVLRGVVHRAGIEAVRAHWPGTEDGFTTLTRLTGLHHHSTRDAASHAPEQAHRELLCVIRIGAGVLAIALTAPVFTPKFGDLHTDQRLTHAAALAAAVTAFVLTLHPALSRRAHTALTLQLAATVAGVWLAVDLTLERSG